MNSSSQSRSHEVNPVELADDIESLFRIGETPSDSRDWKADEWRTVISALRAYGPAATRERHQGSGNQQECTVNEGSTPSGSAIVAALYAELQAETEADAGTVKDYENRAVRRCIDRVNAVASEKRDRVAEVVENIACSIEGSTWGTQTMRKSLANVIREEYGK